LQIAIAKRCSMALVCNDDIILNPGTIADLVDSFRDGLDLVTPRNIRDHALTYNRDYTPEPDFACFMVQPRQFINKFGWFDEGFSPAYFEDNDMAYRIKLAGGRYGARTDVGFYHKGSITQFWNGGRVASHQAFEANQAYYHEKWGGFPGKETYTTEFGI
jgi:GT2 family glycosyltransferase